MSFRSSPFRGAHGPAVAPLVLHYVPLAWFVPLQLGALSILLGWGAYSGVVAAESAPWAVAFISLLAITKLPVVTIRARVEGAYIVVSGCRWPGPVTTWSLTPREANDFVVEITHQGRRSYRRLVLRTADGKVCPLTSSAYQCVAWPHAKVVSRLNGWLALACAELAHDPHDATSVPLVSPRA